jgi:predicted alpha/beta hydrolase
LNDGLPLAGTLFRRERDGPAALVSSATAAPQGLYSAFAGALVGAGAGAVLTYDYRGVGRSARPSSWHRRIAKKEWALCDFAAALAALRQAAPRRPLVGVGQSFGGQALGHLGFFRSRFAQTLRPEFIGWLLRGEPVQLGKKEGA